MIELKSIKLKTATEICSKLRKLLHKTQVTFASSGEITRLKVSPMDNTTKSLKKAIDTLKAYGVTDLEDCGGYTYIHLFESNIKVLENMLTDNKVSQNGTKNPTGTIDHIKKFVSALNRRKINITWSKKVANVIFSFTDKVDFEMILQLLEVWECSPQGENLQISCNLTNTATAIRDNIPELNKWLEVAMPSESKQPPFVTSSPVKSRIDKTSLPTDNHQQDYGKLISSLMDLISLHTKIPLSETYKDAPYLDRAQVSDKILRVFLCNVKNATADQKETLNKFFRSSQNLNVYGIVLCKVVQKGSSVFIIDLYKTDQSFVYENLSKVGKVIPPSREKAKPVESPVSIDLSTVTSFDSLRRIIIDTFIKVGENSGLTTTSDPVRYCTANEYADSEEDDEKSIYKFYLKRSSKTATIRQDHIDDFLRAKSILTDAGVVEFKLKKKGKLSKVVRFDLAKTLANLGVEQPAIVIPEANKTTPIVERTSTNRQDTDTTELADLLRSPEFAPLVQAIVKTMFKDEAIKQLVDIKVTEKMQKIKASEGDAFMEGAFAALQLIARTTFYGKQLVMLKSTSPFGMAVKALIDTGSEDVIDMKKFFAGVTFQKLIKEELEKNK